MNDQKSISLGLLIGQAAGGHPAALHAEANAAGSTDIAYNRTLAQLAEKGLFDLFAHQSACV